MSDQGVDKGRRRFLTASAAVVGGVGGAFAAWPFLSSLQPSAKAQAAGAPVQFDLTKLEEGAQSVVKWRGRPVFVVKRSPEAIAVIPNETNKLSDPESADSDQPEYAVNEYRSIREDVFVVIGLCTHLGCSPKYKPEMVPQPFEQDWKGGFFCPCHGSKFDLAGRVYSGVPAPLNLPVPPHVFIDDNTLLIGQSEV